MQTLISGVSGAKTAVYQAVNAASRYTRAGNFPKWYRQTIKEGDLACKSSTPGCMVFLPGGTAIWEGIQKGFNNILKFDKLANNHYFPLLIPAGLFSKEATFVEGFAPECVVATHTRMMMKEGKMIPDPDAALPEPLVLRPTSEMIIGEFMRDKIRDDNVLPLLVNQWANVFRAEHHTRLFLRTLEFLWQEGHCAFATEEEACQNASKMAQVYRAFLANVCAIPTILGEKSESERFAGAIQTITTEAMMQDGHAVQASTSHYLGQNFSKSLNIKYKKENNEEGYVYTTSWGLSTRVIGCMIMTHGDDNGMRVPPRLAQHHITILPSGKSGKERDAYIAQIENLFRDTTQRFHDERISVLVDDAKTKENAAAKRWNWVRKGMPLAFEVGPREARDKTVLVSRRDRNPEDKAAKVTVPLAELENYVVNTLEEIQATYLREATEFLESHIKTDLTTREEMLAFFADPTQKGFVRAKWCEDRESEALLKEEAGITIRCLPMDQSGTEGTCILTGRPATVDAIFAKSY